MTKTNRTVYFHGMGRMAHAFHNRLVPELNVYIHKRDKPELFPIECGVHISGVNSLGVDWLLSSIAQYPPSSCWLLTKGIKVGTHSIETFPEYLQKELPHWSFGMIAGPALAADLMQPGSLVGLTLASYGLGDTLLPVLDREYIALCETTDIRAVCYLAAFKNVYAIIVGYARYFGVSGQSVLIAAACQELSIVLELMGCDAQLVYSYAGLGDLVVTAYAGRNAQFGELLAQKYTPEAILTGPMAANTVEGYALCLALCNNVSWLEKTQKHLPLMHWLLDAFSRNTSPDYRELIKALSTCA